MGEEKIIDYKISTAKNILNSMELEKEYTLYRIMKRSKLAYTAVRKVVPELVRLKRLEKVRPYKKTSRNRWVYIKVLYEKEYTP